MEVTESEYRWEREALGYLRERLPDSEPFRAWSNFEFIADRTLSKAIERAIDQAGIRPSQRWRRVADYALERLILETDARLDLVRQVAETLAYAHSRRLYHRALSPQTILVTSPDGPRIHVKVFDWQSARRDETTHTGKRITVEDTVRIGLSGDRQSAVYLAPELCSIGAFDAAKMDIFSLGAIAYHVFSGEPPACTVGELHQKLSSGRGLRVSDVLDGVAEPIQELIELATDPNVEDRPGWAAPG